jgi:hypothetical protein
MRMIRNRLLFGLLASLVAATPVQAQSPVRLLGWTDEPTTLPRAGAGVELFRLWAGVSWDRAVAEKAGRLAIRVNGPGGQSETRPIDAGDIAAGGRIPVYVPASWVRNLRPDSVAIDVDIVEAATGRVVAGPLRGGLEAFPGPRTSTTPADPGPFGWGRPLDGPPGAARPLERSGPDGWRFVRVPASKDRAGFFLATTEASNRQVRLRLPGYDPRANRSDDFLLDAEDQPAFGLTPAACLDYLKALRAADPDGPAYRLPTRAEWLAGARAGRDSAFWWGDSPNHPDANLLGDEPALKGDATASASVGTDKIAFHANPWGLLHTFGNVEEWTTDPSGKFVRLGGHFRTEPAPQLEETRVDDPKSTGPDPFVGLRPAFDLTAEGGSTTLRKALAGDPRLAGVSVAFDPERATATLSGTVPEPGERRRADAKVSAFWWVAAVEDRIETPRLADGQLARLGEVAGPARERAPLGRVHYEVPVAVKWGERLAVAGSEYWVNVYNAGGHEAHRMIEGGPDESGRVVVMIERARLTGGDPAVSVALSLGAPAPRPDDPKVVSNVAALRWKAP